MANSVRSHYGRRDLEMLFELQPRAAGKLLEALPTVGVGTSRLVEREALLAFVEKVHDVGDVTAVLEVVRQEKAQASRRRLRTLVQRNDEPVSLTSLPNSLTLERGRVEVRFSTLEELAETMYFLSRAMQQNGEEFAAAFEPALLASKAPAQDVDELSELLKDLEMQEIGRPEILYSSS